MCACPKPANRAGSLQLTLALACHRPLGSGFGDLPGVDLKNLSWAHLIKGFGELNKLRGCLHLPLALLLGGLKLLKSLSSAQPLAYLNSVGSRRRPLHCRQPSLSLPYSPQLIYPVFVQKLWKHKDNGSYVPTQFNQSR